MSNPEKLVTQDTHDEDIQSKNTTLLEVFRFALYYPPNFEYV